MEINTENFGKIEIEADKVIEFSAPILGFDNYTEFTMVNSLEDDIFYWLQSIEDEELSFIVINPFEFVKDYQINISDKMEDKLELTDDDELIVCTLVVVRDEGSRITTNLKAPIIINATKNKAGQVVLETDYPTRHCLWEEEKREEVSG